MAREEPTERGYETGIVTERLVVLRVLRRGRK